MYNAGKKSDSSGINEYQYMLLTVFDVEVDELKYLTTPIENFITLSIWKKMTETQFNCLYYLLHGLDIPFSQRHSIFVDNVVIYNNRIKKIAARARDKNYRKNQKKIKNKGE